MDLILSEVSGKEKKSPACDPQPGFSNLNSPDYQR
jgi:hypothetical protein